MNKLSLLNARLLHIAYIRMKEKEREGSEERLLLILLHAFKINDNHQRIAIQWPHFSFGFGLANTDSLRQGRQARVRYLPTTAATAFAAVVAIAIESHSHNCKLLLKHDQRGGREVKLLPPPLSPLSNVFFSFVLSFSLSQTLNPIGEWQIVTTLLTVSTFSVAFFAENCI